MMRPKEVLLQWIDAFNNANVDKIAALYDEHAVNHQVANDPVESKQSIKSMFEAEFATANPIAHNSALLRKSPRQCLLPPECAGHP